MPDRLRPRLRAAARRLWARLPAGLREELLDDVAGRPDVIARVLRREDVTGHVARLDEAALARLATALAAHRATADDPDDPVGRALVRAVAERVPFEVWERNGWHLTRNRPGSPIPDTSELPESLWKEPSELPGLELRAAAQIALLEEAAGTWGEELAALPRRFDGAGRFFLANGSFGPVDAELAWALVRANRPRRIVQVGGGWSSLLAAQALAANAADGHDGRLLVAEPWPWDFLRDLASSSDRVELREAPVRSLGLEVFEALGPGDMVWLDSSHVCRTGGDVQYEVLELLPRLAPGVLVHFQGIWLPEEYPREWLTGGGDRRFWNEQYVVQAFLAFNGGYEVVWASRWMRAHHAALLAEHLPSTASVATDPTSLWIRRVDAAGAPTDAGPPRHRDGL